MTVAELAAMLSSFPSEMPVRFLYEARCCEAETATLNTSPDVSSLGELLGT
jgi:hypothetical protein